jgi:5-(carboxyamino)imidazole ribonucleotide synthase
VAPAGPPGTAAARRAPVGFVGAGQLARMLCQAAVGLGITPRLLAAVADDSAALVDPDVVLGDPGSLDALRALASTCAVTTFDHELVDPDHLAVLEAEGHVLRPGAATAAVVVDKRRQRELIGALGLDQPAWRALDPGATAAAAGVRAHGAEHGWPVVLKAARGGYDGRGVRIVDGPSDVDAAVASMGTAPLLVEEGIAIAVEVAIQVARRPGGELAVYPVVETVQRDGICVEVVVPAAVAGGVAVRAESAARRLAEAIDLVGLLAVELFVDGAGRLTVNELAVRPHNSAHHTIEACETSQFENHLRAVLDLPLGATTLRAPHAVMVNVLGPPDGSDPADRLASALAVPGAHVHLYAKGAKAGRKLGHVTVCGADAHDVRSRAWQAARALGGDA